MPSRAELLREFLTGWRELGRPQAGILEQLIDAYSEGLKSFGGDGRSATVITPRAPLDFYIMELHDDCEKEVNACLGDDTHTLDELLGLRLKARQVLGYDARIMTLSVVCPTCEGALIVARDASSAVTCAKGCGVEYPTSTWLQLLEQK